MVYDEKLRDIKRTITNHTVKTTVIVFLDAQHYNDLVVELKRKDKEIRVNLSFEDFELLGFEVLSTMVEQVIRGADLGKQYGL